jgi:hypothetical protein
MILPFATYKPVARMNDGPRENYRAAILHTNGGKVPADGDLYNWWMHGAAPDIGAHLQVTWEGRVFQYLDTNRYTGHAWDANHWTVGIETEDGGDPSRRWTNAQINSIVRILLTLDVPPKGLLCLRSHGIGYHQQCDTWNKRKHNCPGPVRRNQIGIIVERLREVHMALKELAADMGTSEDRMRRALDYLLGVQASIDNKGLPTDARRAIGYAWAEKAGDPAATHSHPYSGRTGE